MHRIIFRRDVSLCDLLLVDLGSSGHFHVSSEASEADLSYDDFVGSTMPMQRTGASRFGQSQIERLPRLATVADWTLGQTVHPFANKFSILVRLAKFALLAIPVLALAAVLRSALLAILGLLILTPCFVYAYVLTILHWKSRYRGEHSDLWGVLLLIETSGWFKLIYIFRHVRPDMQGRGRYSRDNDVA